MSTDLAVIEAALEAATPGPWAVCPWYPQGVMPKAWADDQLPVEERGPFMSTGTVGDGADVGTERPEADAHLIANAPTWLAELVERVKAAEAAIERVRRFGHDAKREYAHISGCGGDPECPACWAHDILRALDGDA